MFKGDLVLIFMKINYLEYDYLSFMDGFVDERFWVKLWFRINLKFLLMLMFFDFLLKLIVSLIEFIFIDFV